VILKGLNIRMDEIQKPKNEEVFCGIDQWKIKESLYLHSSFFKQPNEQNHTNDVFSLLFFDRQYVIFCDFPISLLFLSSTLSFEFTFLFNCIFRCDGKEINFFNIIGLDDFLILEFFNDFWGMLNFRFRDIFFRREKDSYWYTSYYSHYFHYFYQNIHLYYKLYFLKH
jgi:hypothetical protein